MELQYTEMGLRHCMTRGVGSISSGFLAFAEDGWVNHRIFIKGKDIAQTQPCIKELIM